MHPFSFIPIHQLPIIEQLRLEEALLRADERNFCFINQQAQEAIVFGISAKPQEMVHREQISEKIFLIKRFTGGGTVVVDSDTIFMTIIANDSVSKASPKEILKWAYELLKPFFKKKSFQLQENDFTFGEKKIAGNALYVKKGRWLLHTSFLWDYQKEMMNLLTLPEKRPEYRKTRTHEHFVTALKEHYPDKKKWIDSFTTYLQSRLNTKILPFKEAKIIQNKEHRLSTTLLDSI